MEVITFWFGVGHFSCWCRICRWPCHFIFFRRWDRRRYLTYPMLWATFTFHPSVFAQWPPFGVLHQSSSFDSHVLYWNNLVSNPIQLPCSFQVLPNPSLLDTLPKDRLQHLLRQNQCLVNCLGSSMLVSYLAFWRCPFVWSCLSFLLIGLGWYYHLGVL